MTKLLENQPKQGGDSLSATKVALIFPPLVNTNFGSYFPSTAVLSAYLKQHGFSCRQFDLNEELALYLLLDDNLQAMGEGRMPNGKRLDPSSIEAAVARGLLRNKDKLFDAQGRHRFAEDGPGKLVSQLAQPLLMDAPLSELLEGGQAAELFANVYQPFFEQTKICSRLGSDIKLVGISVPMGPQLAPALLLSRYLKASRPDLRIVWGGPALSLMAEPDLCLLLQQCAEIDAIVRYDGEAPLLALVEQLEQQRWDPAEIPGVSSRAGDNVVHIPPAAGPRLGELPFADYSPELMERLANPEAGVVQARGCYWGRCSYCDFVELYEGSPRYRTRSAEQLADEMAFQVERHGIRRFALITESIPAKLARRLGEELLRRDLKVSWNSFAMVDKRFTREVFQVMAASGCDKLVIGMETMVDRVLKKVEKAATRAENIRFMQDAHAEGVNLYINLIPDLPSTTYAEATAALDTFRQYRDCIKSAAVFPFESTRSSAVGRNPERFGLIPVTSLKRSGQAQYAANHLGVIDPAMTDEERTDIHRQYRRFADEVRAARAAPQQTFLDLVENVGLPFRLAAESLEISESKGDVYCMNIATSEYLKLSGDWLPVLTWLREQRSTSLAELGTALGDLELARNITRQLGDHRMLSPVEKSSARLAAEPPWVEQVV